MHQWSCVLTAFPEQDEESGGECRQGQSGGAGQQGAEGRRHHRAGQFNLPYGHSFHDI